MPDDNSNSGAAEQPCLVPFVLTLRTDSGNPTRLQALHKKRTQSPVVPLDALHGGTEKELPARGVISSFRLPIPSKISSTIRMEPWEWWALGDSNTGQIDYESTALTN